MEALHSPRRPRSASAHPLPLPRHGPPPTDLAAARTQGPRGHKRDALGGALGSFGGQAGGEMHRGGVEAGGV